MSRRIPTDNLGYAVLLSINEGKSLGSGFRLKANGQNYLVTAKHVLFDRHNQLYGETLIVTCHSSNRGAISPLIMQVDLSNAKIITSNKSDVAAVLLGRNEPIDGHDHKTSLNKLKVNQKRPTKLVGEKYVSLIEQGSGEAVSVDAEALGKLSLVSITNDVYLLGYPTSLGMQHSQYYDFTKPLVRKGIVAGIDETKSTFVIDCPAYPGNSGGPVVEHCEDGYFRVTGVVSKYIPYETKWHSNRGDIVNTDVSNSGYTVCVSVDVVLSILSGGKS
jgi:S1-C subfamily serine protease